MKKNATNSGNTQNTSKPSGVKQGSGSRDVKLDPKDKNTTTHFELIG